MALGGVHASKGACPMLVVTDRLQQYNASVGMIIWSSTFESTVDCSNSVSSFPWLLVSRYDSRSAVMEGRWGWVAWHSEEQKAERSHVVP